MTYIPSGIGELAVLGLDNEYLPIEVFTGFNLVDGEAATSQRPTLSRVTGIINNVGVPGPGEVSFDYDPGAGFAGIRALQAHRKARTLATLRYRLDEPSVLLKGESGKTLAIAAVADAFDNKQVITTLTASGLDLTTPPWQVGLGVVFGGALWVIEAITGKLAAKVSRYGSVVGATGAENPVEVAPEDPPSKIAAVGAGAAWGLVEQGVQLTMTGRVVRVGGKQSGSDGAVSATCQISLSTDAQERARVIPAIGS